jgi:hypothetical protein
VPFDFSERFVEIEDSDLMSIAKGLDVADHAVGQHADLGRQFLESSDFRLSYGAQARTLTSLLDEVSAPLRFDLLSLDVEGNELSVLKGLDLQRYRPIWILVEVRGRDVADFLVNSGYELRATLSDNGVYQDLLFHSCESV